MLKLVPIIVDPSRDFTNSGGVGPPNESSRRNPFVYHVPTPTNCSLISHNSSPNNQSSPLTQCVWTFFWLAVLMFVAYPVGVVAGQLYIVVSPLLALCCCCDKLSGHINSFLLWTMHLPLICGQNMATAKPLIVI